MTEKFLTDEYESGLSSEIKEALDLCSKVADLNKFKIYLIGGIVRDLILKNQIFDVDIIVEGNAIDFARLLEKNYACSILQIQKDLKTAKVEFENQIVIDFASTRCESYPKAGFLPILTAHSCSLEEDVKRRDFTINAMAIALNSEKKFMLVDYLDGFSDIKQKKLRILHNDSFVEDPSRIVRGLKFAIRFGFDLEENTKRLQYGYLNSPINESMPLERVKGELKQLFSLNSYIAFDSFISQKIYRLFLQEKPCSLEGSYLSEVIKEFSINYHDIWLFYLGIVLIGQDKKLLDRLNLSGREQRAILDASELVKKPLKEFSNNFEIYEFFHKKSDLAAILYYAVTKDDYVKFYLKQLKGIKLLISGEDLIQLGLTPSKSFSEIFKQVLAKKINVGLDSKQDELDYVKLILESFD